MHIQHFIISSLATEYFTEYVY